MANIPYVEIHKDPRGHPWVVVVTSARHYEDGFLGCHWQLYSAMHGKLESYGYSKGYGGDGRGSALTAMANAKKAMRRRWKKLRCSSAKTTP